MVLGLSTRIESAAPSFNTSATFNTMPYQATSRPTVTALSAKSESNIKGAGIAEMKQAIGAKLGQEIKPNDGGNAGAGFGGGALGQFSKLLTGIVAGGMGGPVGAAVAGGIAINEGMSFMAQQKPALAEYEGASSFTDYSRSRSGKIAELKSSDDDYAASRISNYEDALGKKYHEGFPVRQFPLMGALPETAAADAKQEEMLRKQYGTLDKQSKDLAEQGTYADKFALDNNIAVAKGPKPPSGGPGFVSMPGMP